MPARQDERRLRQWAAREGLDSLPVAYDEGGKLSRALGADLLPHHVVIDRKGRVDRVDAGLTRGLKDRIAVLLGGGRRG